MSGICGIIRVDGGSVPPEATTPMTEVASYRGPDGVTEQSGASWSAAYLALWITPEDAVDAQPASSGSSWLVADARIDNLDELRGLLSADLAGAPPTSSAVLHASFRRWGPACVDHIVGDYAFVLWDAVRHQVFAARDHSGVRSLHYAFDGTRLVFATEVKQVLAAPGMTARLFEPAVAGYLAGGYSRPEWTFYEGIRTLPPGHLLEVSRDGAHARRFWNPDPARRIRYVREASYAEHFRDLLEESVRTRIRSPRPVGVMLSGGTDSGSVTSVAANLRRVDPGLTPELRTYSFAFEDLPDSDERAISDAIVTEHGLPAVPVPGDDAWPLSGFPQYGPERDSPFAWVYQHMMDRSAAMAAGDGVGVLLTGEGGDELVGDEVYDLAGMVMARPFRLRREVEALAARWETNPKRVVKRDVLRPLRRRLAAFPGLEPLAPRSAGSRPYRAPVVSPALARHSDLDRLVLDAPRHLWQDLTPRERRRVRLTGNHLPRLLAWQEHLHARHGLGAAMPLADARLVRFVLAIPPWVVNTPSETKRIIRRAVRGVMPESARQGARKVIPLGLYRRGMNERGVSVLKDLGQGRELVRRGFVDPGALAEAVDVHLSGQTPKYDLWWALTMEWWLRTYWQDA